MQVKIFTDGSCLNNPGPGGAAALIVPENGSAVELSQGYTLTTNNRMELRAVIMALEYLDIHDGITVITDSQYVKNGITTWMRSWKSHGWLTSDRKPVKNQDLWRRLDELCQKCRPDWQWVRGHNGHPENERCDGLARAAAQGDKKVADTGFDPQHR